MTCSYLTGLDGETCSEGGGVLLVAPESLLVSWELLKQTDFSGSFSKSESYFLTVRQKQELTRCLLGNCQRAIHPLLHMRTHLEGNKTKINLTFCTEAKKIHTI